MEFLHLRVGFPGSLPRQDLVVAPRTKYYFHPAHNRLDCHDEARSTFLRPYRRGAVSGLKHPRVPTRLEVMSVVIVTGSGGLVGSAAVRMFAERGLDVVGIDNDMRKFFFGDKGSTLDQTRFLESRYSVFKSLSIDIRDYDALSKVFKDLGPSISAVVHCAAQPSHDWAAQDPLTDFSVNANGTLNLLQLSRNYAESAAFIFMSTNKVYGNRPNEVDLVETESRWTPGQTSRWVDGFDESLSIDQSTHSLFGVSKAAADLLVQEYGRYFGMNTVVFRGGCLTGPGHAGVELHGFLSYLVKCAVWDQPYTIFGHKGKQVRDNIHSDDLSEAFWSYFSDPSPGEVFNIGGGLEANVSVLEAIRYIEELSGKTLSVSTSNSARKGDHIWYVSSLTSFKNRFPGWRINYSIHQILEEMVVYETHKRGNA